MGNRAKNSLKIDWITHNTHKQTNRATSSAPVGANIEIDN